MQLFAFLVSGLVLCLTAFMCPCQSQSQAKLDHGVNFGLNGNESKCDWVDCTVEDPKFGQDMKKLLSEYSLVTLDLKFDQQVHEECFNQTNLYNSTIPAALWIWLAWNNQIRGENTSKQFISHSGSDLWFRKSFEGQLSEVTVVCFLRPYNDSDLNDTARPSLNDLITQTLIEKVTNYTELPNSGTVLCYKEYIKSSVFVCLDAVDVTTSKVERPNNFVDWPHLALKIMAIAIGVVFALYSPLLLCLFYPTEVSINGERVIVLGGASPVGIRSCIVNRISRNVNTLKGTYSLTFFFLLMFSLASLCGRVLLTIILPSSSYLWKIDSMLCDAKRLLIFFNSLGIFWTLRILLSNRFKKLSVNGVCLTCKLFGDAEIIHQRLLEELRQHLRLQPSIVMKCCKLCLIIATELAYQMLSTLCVPEVCESECLCCILMACFCPFAAVLFLIGFAIGVVISVISFLLSVIYSCPLSSLYALLLLPVREMQQNLKCKAIFPRAFLYIVVGLTLCSGVMTSVGISVSTMTVFLLAFIRGILTSVPNLPYATFSIVIAYYVWSCYRSFTTKYNHLALKLYKHYKPSAQNVDNMSTRPNSGDGEQHGEAEQVVTLREGELRVIPKKLFRRARKELMPVRQSLGLFVVQFILIFAFFFVVFAVIMETPDAKASDRVKATATFLTALVPKIIEIVYSKDSEMQKFNDEFQDKNIKSLVDNYSSTTQNNNSNASGDVSSVENEMSGLLGNEERHLQNYNTLERSINTDNGVYDHDDEGNEFYHSCQMSRI